MTYGIPIWAIYTWFVCVWSAYLYLSAACCGCGAAAADKPWAVWDDAMGVVTIKPTVTLQLQSARGSPGAGVYFWPYPYPVFAAVGYGEIQRDTAR